MNLSSFENHLFDEGGLKYTRNEEYAEEIGYIKWVIFVYILMALNGKIILCKVGFMFVL